LAWVGDSIVTLLTFEVAELARAELACVLMTVANTWPFCSSVIRLATGVLALKNAAQLASMAACSAELPAVPLADVDGAAEAVAVPLDDEGGELGEDAELPLLPQAATAIPTAPQAAGTRRI
jgi:hypothetical protein